MRPVLLRPALPFIGAMSERSGSERVISAKSETVMNRMPADVGLKVLTPMGDSLRRRRLVEVDRRTGRERDVRLLPVAELSGVLAEALRLAAHDDRADSVDLHAVQGLDR